MSARFWLLATLHSGLVVAGVTALSLVIAVPSAWLIERTDLPGAGWLRRIFTLSYALPSYLLAIAWVLLANPGVGWLNRLAPSGEAWIDIYSLGGVIFVESSVLFTILFLGVSAGLRRMDPALEEAARLAGASPFTVFRRVTAPLLKGNVLAGLVAVGLASLASFGVPAILGSPARIFVLTTAIYAKIQEGSAAALDEAMAIALVMATITLGLVTLAGLWARRQVSLVGGKASRPALVGLGRWRHPLAVLLFGVWGVMVALPLAALLVSSFCDQPGVLRLDNFSLRAWRYVLFSLRELRVAFTNSLLTASTAAFIAVGGALLLAVARWHGFYQGRRRLGRLARLAEHAALFFFSLPGTVLALTLIIVLGRSRLSDTLALLVLAYVIKYVTLGMQTVRPSAFLIDTSLVEAAQLAGAGVLSRLRRVWLPLLRAPLAAAALLVFMPCFSELTMSILLHGPGTQTLGVVLFTLQEYADRSSAAVVGTLLVGMILVVRAAGRRLEGEH